MDTVKDVRMACPDEASLSAYLDGSLAGDERSAVQAHIASCDACLIKVVSAHESVEAFRKQKKGTSMKKVNWYFLGMLVSFILSFVFPRYFLQFLIAAVILAVKWIIDSRNTRMLIMIHEAWRKGGEKEASRILGAMDAEEKKRY